MIAETIRQWLLTKPQPHALRLTCGEEERIVPRGSCTWLALAKTICALNPSLIEALDERGGIIRATQGETDELAPESPRAAPNPALPPTLVDVSTLQLVSKLLADAYKHSTETAFERLASLFDSVNRRSENLERSLATSERMRLREAQQAIEMQPEESDVAGIIRSFMPEPTDRNPTSKGH